MDLNISPLVITAFQAPSDPERCAEFLREHRKVLEDFGITNVTTNEETWMHDPDTYVIVAEHPELGMVGGVRIQLAHADQPLPMVHAVGKLDPSVHTVLDRLAAEGKNAELCGLWNAHRYVRRGLPLLLGYASAALASQLGLRTMVCLIAHYTLHHALKVGFTVLDEVGDGGTFSYPIPSIKAIALYVPDVIGAEHITSIHRRRVLSLRLRPDQITEEAPMGKPMTVDYRLNLRLSAQEVDQYKGIIETRLRYSA
ncbi:MAG: hypothetical protein QM724_09650 [Flavobacteriales bacterium]